MSKKLFTPLERAANFSRRLSSDKADGGFKPLLAQTVRKRSSLTGFTTVQFVLLSALWIFPVLAEAYPNEPACYRDFKWQTPKSDFEGLTLVNEYGSSREYTRASEDLNFNGFPATRIVFLFTEDRLEIVTVQLETDDEAKKMEIRQFLMARYGPGKKIGDKDVFWQGEITHIKYNTYGRGVEIIFSDAAEWSQRLSRVESFKNRVLAVWQKLNKTKDTPAAVRELKKWLLEEGKDSLDSFSISANGEQIVLAFKGAGTTILTPMPDNMPQSFNSKKKYTVAEVDRLLKTDPQELRDKDILLKDAAIVDLVAGIGCHDYYIICDEKDAALYRRRYERNLSLQDQAAVKKIPQILSGPTLGMPQGVVIPMEHALYRGHFFDKGLNSCDDGWKRFVILDKQKEQGRK